MTGILDELDERSLIAQTTDIDALRRDLDSGSITLYVGFDPTAPSLHLGNLSQILTARRFQLHGHRPLLLVGGATGLIGDPSGKAGERSLNTTDVVAGWVDRIRGQVERYFDFDGPSAARVVNNLDWTAPVSAIEFLRDIGKHFSVNRMLDREAVATRLAGAGISYTEFSYVLLQSFDFLELFRRYGCTLQTGGSDQWGNIVAGVDLIRRVEGAHAHALSTPLIVKADGTKFGKTESGTVWLDPALTSPYAFHQFWLNADDRDIPTLLRTFSFRPLDEIASLEAATLERPSERAAQRALADELTTLVHGEAEAAAATRAAAALFGRGDLADLPEQTLGAALREAGLGIVAPDEVSDGNLPPVSELLVRCGLSASKAAARRTVAEGGVSVNNAKVAVDDADAPIPLASLLYGRWLVLRRGRRAVAGVHLGDPDLVDPGAGE